MKEEAFKMQDFNRRRSRRNRTQKSRAWAVATPLLAAFSRPTPSAPGVATAQVVQQSCLPRRRERSTQTNQQI